MKKRVAALLMALVMLVGLLPSAVWAEVAVTPVSTAAELAALGGKQISGSYKLTADIDMTGQTMQPIKKFSSGTFDGQGHTISGLTIAASSGNTGLFAETGSGAVIQGIVLQNANVSLSSGSYVGVGALVGKVSGRNRDPRVRRLRQRVDLVEQRPVCRRSGGLCLREDHRRRLLRRGFRDGRQLLQRQGGRPDRLHLFGGGCLELLCHGRGDVEGRGRRRAGLFFHEQQQQGHAHKLLRGL